MPPGQMIGHGNVATVQTERETRLDRPGDDLRINFESRAFD
jgi:hypothetical protein